MPHHQVHIDRGCQQHSDGGADEAVSLGRQHAEKHREGGQQRRRGHE
jgi:hypothetical protein